jgi:hypothetical protein
MIWLLVPLVLVALALWVQAIGEHLDSGYDEIVRQVRWRRYEKARDRIRGKR